MCIPRAAVFWDIYAKVRIPVYDRQFIFSLPTSNWTLSGSPYISSVGPGEGTFSARFARLRDFNRLRVFFLIYLRDFPPIFPNFEILELLCVSKYGGHAGPQFVKFFWSKNSIGKIYISYFLVCCTWYITWKTGNCGEWKIAQLYFGIYGGKTF